MGRMVDLIRDGVAPMPVLRRAAQGGLSLPAGEAIEILVVLAAHRELGIEAEQTLENWDEQVLAEVAGNVETPAEVLLHLWRLGTPRPAVVEALSENPGLPLAELEAMGIRGDAEMLRAMLRSARVRGSSRLLGLMTGNPAAEAVRPELNRWMVTAQRDEAETVAANFLVRHAEDVAKEETQRFELVAVTEGEDDALDKLLTRVKRGDTAVNPEEREQLSLLQRLGRMRVGERIKVAVSGNREERMVLIRDRSKLVSLAVLESPKVADTEMESFATMKNVQEAVLRAISLKRQYMKHYAVIRALVYNPKTPLDVAMPLVAHLLVKDQRGLAVNKNVNDTIRKMAAKIYRTSTQRKAD